MKKLTTILSVMLFATLILSSCGEETKNGEIAINTEDLKGKYFTRLDQDAAIYFINDKELIRSFVTEGDVISVKYKYSVKGDELTIHNKKKDDAGDKDSKYIVYNNEVIMNFFEKDKGDYEYPRGVSYKLSE
jgi:hypothetical protein